MRCLWCNIHRDYYHTEENARRRNCAVSESGYHTFVYFPCIVRLFVRTREARPTHSLMPDVDPGYRTRRRLHTI